MTEERDTHAGPGHGDPHPHDPQPGGRKVLVVAVAALVSAAAALLFAAFTGNASLLLGAGAAAGAWAGVHFGNKKAREVDAYREEWLGRRAGTAHRTKPAADSDETAGRATAAQNAGENKR